MLEADLGRFWFRVSLQGRERWKNGSRLNSCVLSQVIWKVTWLHLRNGVGKQLGKGSSGGGHLSHASISPYLMEWQRHDILIRKRELIEADNKSANCVSAHSVWQKTDRGRKIMPRKEFIPLEINWQVLLHCVWQAWWMEIWYGGGAEIGHSGIHLLSCRTPHHLSFYPVFKRARDVPHRIGFPFFFDKKCVYKPNDESADVFHSNLLTAMTINLQDVHASTDSSLPLDWRWSHPD